MNILVIGAHADDIELGCAGAICKHISEGCNVYELLITHSAYESYDGTVIRSKETAMKECLQASKVLGIKKTICLEYETKYVEYGVQLIEDINKVIDEYKIDTIYTHWDGDINQDHSAVARATIVAGRNVPRILMYRSNWYKSNKDFTGKFYIDISEYLDTKINAIKSHKSEVDKRGEKWIDFFISQNRIFGIEIGVEHAELFQVIKWMY
jgi:LmbE family N-acetylglucosaminyl deacetylase